MKAGRSKMDVIQVLLWVGQGLIYLVFGWMIILAIIGNKKKCRKEITQMSIDKHRFAILICAHNEEQVIGSILDSLREQTYDAANWKVYVIADRCSDDTAKIAMQYDFVTVLHRNTEGESRKGLALQWGIENVLEREGNAMDIIMVLDADNLVIPEFLELLNKKFCEGSTLVTGRRVSMNPYDTLVSKWYSVYWSIVSELFCRSHSNLHLSSLLSGTGFAFSVSILNDNKFCTLSMSEDIEFSIQQNLKGIRVDYVEDAIFYDEQPTRLSVMYKQLRRWTTGSYQITKMYSVRMLKELFHKPSLLLLDSFISLILCGNMCILSFVGLGNVWLAVAHQGTWLFYAAAMGFIINITTILIALAAIKKSPLSLRKIWDGVLLFPVFTFIISFISICSYIRPQTKWHKIDHYGK